MRNKGLEKAFFYNLAQNYQSESTVLIFIDELHYYIPPNLELGDTTLIRPEFMLDSVDYYINTGQVDRLSKNDIRQLKELSYSTLEKIKTFVLSRPKASVQQRPAFEIELNVELN